MGRILKLKNRQTNIFRKKYGFRNYINTLEISFDEMNLIFPN